MYSGGVTDFIHINDERFPKSNTVHQNTGVRPSVAQNAGVQHPEKDLARIHVASPSGCNRDSTGYAHILLDALGLPLTGYQTPKNTKPSERLLRHGGEPTAHRCAADVTSQYLADHD
jgi:hypothetical protein